LRARLKEDKVRETLTGQGNKFRTGAAEQKAQEPKLRLVEKH